MYFFKYFKLFNRLTEGKLYIYVLISLVAVVFQGLAALSFAPVLFMDNPEKASSIPVCRFSYSILNRAGISETDEMLFWLLSVATACFTLSCVGLVFSKIYSATLITDLLKKVQVEMNEKLLSTKYEYFVSQNLGILNNVMMQQVTSAANAIKHYSNIIVNVMFASLYLLFPVMLDIRLILMLIPALVPLVLILRFINSKNTYYSIKRARALGIFNKSLLLILSNFKYFKAAAAEKIVLKKLKKDLFDFVYLKKRRIIWSSITPEVAGPYIIALISAVVYYVFVSGSSLTQVIMLFAALYAAYQKLMKIPLSYQKFLGGIGSIQIYQEFEEDFDRNMETLGQAADEHLQKPDFSGPISFDNVTFRYRNSILPVLDKINLKIHPRKSIALVGDSGSGKSTIINLLTGLLQPTEGKISLSGINYEDMDIRELRSKTGYVTQEPVVFNDTVRNNITRWDDADNPDKLKSSAVKAHAHEFIEQMPEKYESMLGEHGVNTSGGQRQRISIAREIYRDTPLLIMDEATSSLDSKTEQIIHESIDEYKGEKTLVIIAHRLSTIKSCDYIYVLDKGQIIEEGGYMNLYNAGGRFRNMVDTQSLDPHEKIKEEDR